MSFSALKKKAHSLLDEANWVAHIKNNKEYELALQLMDDLIEDYDYNLPFIEILSASINRWENESKSFSKFNKTIHGMDQGVSLLKVLMDQYDLGITDFPEIGSKSLVSKVLNGHRRLTVDHINALSKRFGISPVLFFSSDSEH
ncbi:MAG: transcriptional regulator [Gammaproteobacteria bacterium]|nr:transcriptional regulator [Gammaproteobacteria bacterium]